MADVWTHAALWLGLALSTTSVAVVYSVRLELGLNLTEFGKIVLAACFIHDLLGSRGRSKVGRWMPGPVSERAPRHAHCPVTVIR